MKQNHEKKTRTDGVIVSPDHAKILELKLVEDEVFSEGILGDGVALLPETGEICAPANGVIDAVFDSRHAVSMTADCGAELLIHCGIDTVELKGEGFAVSVTAGTRVKVGDPLIRFDPKWLKERGYYISTPVIVVNGEHFVIRKTDRTAVRRGDMIMTLEARGKEKA